MRVMLQFLLQVVKNPNEPCSNAWPSSGTKSEGVASLTEGKQTYGIINVVTSSSHNTNENGRNWVSAVEFILYF